VFPTSTENYTSTTLPYFVRANGSRIWFNEHYGNRIASIDTQLATLTEYSVSNPPATNGSQIDNALTISVGSDRTWFTAVTANYIGFVSAKYKPAFGIGLLDSSPLTLKRGTTTTLALGLVGNSQAPLRLEFSDSESPTSKLKGITISSTLRFLSSLSGQKLFTINISADTSIAPGKYTLVITATDGLISRSAFSYVTVT
jgi:hypothetical protein